MKQKSTQTFTSEGNKITLACDSDTPLGCIHDFLLLLKGGIVDKILKAQKDEEEVNDSKKPEIKPEIKTP